ncbi:MAG: ATP-dependent zinc metalloprotease FtsH [Thermoguttaceae bacterium]|nr:ATP-dependent zinc metalloprotease FtsH [Thermoguttaceae bacterium]
MVERKSKKVLNKVFSAKYSCEVPTFAFSDQLVDARLREKLDSYSSETPQDGSSWIMLISVGVSILFLVLLFKMFRNTSEQMFGGGFGLGGFGRSLAKRYEPRADKRVTFEDVAGMDAVKAELVEIVDYLKNPRKYERMGARVPKGTLLFGPPGTGKTLLARAVAGEANVPFFSINGSEFIQLFVGVGASRVRDLFATAKENAPSILFIDEIDAVGRQRGAGLGGGQDEREQTLNQILSEMDGFSQNDSVMVMASTNRPDVLDPALMRPGRFDRHITVGRPSMRGRVDIFKVYLKKIPYGPDVDVDKLAKTTSGFTGADIRNFVNEATLWATRNNKKVVESSDFDFAFEKISLGLKRDEIVTPENKRKTARHEAGHALVGWFLPNGSRVHKITIVPRGRALGVTWSLPDDDQLNYNESEARATLTHLLAGRAAEKLVYNENSSGVENDLQRATELARNMVARWGMSDKLGPVAFSESEANPFLGKEVAFGSRNYSEDAARIIDEEVRRTIEEADARARALLIEKRDLFDKLTDALVAEEELDEARIREILGPSPNDKPKTDETALEDEPISDGSVKTGAEPSEGDAAEDPAEDSAV